MQSKRTFWIIIVATHAAFLVFQITSTDPFLADSYEYLYAAENLVTHGTLYAGDLSEPIEPALYTKRPPLYPLMLAVTGAHTGFVLIALVVQNLLSLLNIYLVLRLFQRVESLRNSEWIALSLILLYPSQLIYANMIMSELLFQTVLVGAFYVFSLYVLDGKPAYLLTYNILLAAAAMTKPVMYLFVLPNLAWMSVLAWQRRDFRCVAYALVPLVIVVGYSTWNLQRTGFFHFSSIQSASLLDYNTRYLLVHMHGPEVADSLISNVHVKASHVESFAERQQIRHGGAWDLIRPRLPSYVLFHLRGVIAFFLDPGRFDIYNFFGLQSDKPGLLYHFSARGPTGIWAYVRTQPALIIVVLLMIAAANIIKTAGLAVFAFGRQRPHLKWGLLLLVGYVAVATGPNGAARFAVPVFPLLLLAVLFAIARINHLRANHATRDSVEM